MPHPIHHRDVVHAALSLAAIAKPQPVMIGMATTEFRDLSNAVLAKRRERSRSRFFTVSLILISLLVLPAFAQTGSGTIQGNVTDPSGAAVPGVNLILKQSATQREYATSSNAVGFFIFPPVPPGDYSLSVAATGFDKWEGRLTLQVGQTGVVNPTLKLASSSTAVTVAGDVTPLLTMTSATLGTAIERARIEQLPLNGRFLQGLIMTTNPGMEGGAGNPSVFGLREGSMEFLQDGAVLANRDTGNISSRPPGLDTIEEFKVETNNSSAKMNRPATAIISTKAGTNDLHGAAFETARNNAIGVARRREDFYDKPPHLVRNEFGASLGGPVYLPKVYNGKNRTFFFAAYEAYRLRSATTTSLTMPTMAMRQGDFGGLIDGVGRRYTVYDPWTTDTKTWMRQPYPNNRIPLSRESPVGKYYFDITPAPTMPDVNPMVSANYFGASPSNETQYTATGRIDHRFSERDQVFGRYSHGMSSSEARRESNSNGSPMLLNGVANRDLSVARTESAVVSWSHMFSPTFFSETVASGSLEDWNYNMPEQTKDINYADQLGLPNPFGSFGLPDIRATGFDMLYQGVKPRKNITRIILLDENLTKIRGRHELQLGVRYRREGLEVLPDQQFTQGNHNFNALATSLYDPTTGSAYGATPRTGHITANIFLGVARSYQVRFTRQWYNLQGREYSGYFQDNFKATSRLTLNLGLRYEFYPPMREVDNLFTGFDPKTKTILTEPLDKLYALGATTPAIVKTYTTPGAKFGTPQQAGVPARFIKADRWNFWPRAGFAYRLFDGARATVLRGGFGIYGFPTPLRTFDGNMRMNAPFDALFTVDTGTAAQSPDGKANWGLRSVPTVIAGVNSKDVIDPNNPSGLARGSFNIAYFNPEQPTTRAQEWNLTLEREVWNNTVVRAGYIGTHGSRLDLYNFYNEAPNNYVWFKNTGEPIPTGPYAGVAMRYFDQESYGSLKEYQKTGWSNTNGVQLELVRRYSRGYGFQFFYVMSNAFGLSNDFGGAAYLYPTPNLYLAGAIPSDGHEAIKFLNYQRNTAIPKHRVRWNWIADLPFGRGKKFGSNAGGIMDRIIGGWQIAGSGSIRSNYWALPTANYGYLGKIETYGKKYPIEDCRSGDCIPGYLWYNGYIPANRINSYDAQGRPNGVMGVPDNYQPAHKPLIPIPADGGSPSDPNAPYYDSNTTWTTLKNGTTQRVGMDTNLHPWMNQYELGPMGWGLDASLFKRVRITERVFLRFNADFFNVLNNPGMTQPSSASGIVSLRNSANAARQLQLTLRLMW